MFKYVKIIDEQSGLCDIALGNDYQYYQSIGFVEKEIEKSEIDDHWYLKEKLYTEDYLEEFLSLEKAKKLNENKAKREEKLKSGVNYKEIIFDSDSEQKSNLNSVINSISETENITWFGLDGISHLNCSKSDLININNLINEQTARVWAELNPKYIQEIQNAKSLTELNAITIKY